MKDTFGIISIDRRKYTSAMSENLAVLRAKAGISQESLANKMGITRQTVSAVENRQRELSWPNFVSLLFLFMHNENTRELVSALGIYTEELADFFTMTDLSSLKNK